MIAAIACIDLYLRKTNAIKINKAKETVECPEGNEKLPCRSTPSTKFKYSDPIAFDGLATSEKITLLKNCESNPEMANVKIPNEK